MKKILAGVGAIGIVATAITVPIVTISRKETKKEEPIKKVEPTTEKGGQYLITTLSGKVIDKYKYHKKDVSFELKDFNGNIVYDTVSAWETGYNYKTESLHKNTFFYMTIKNVGSYKISRKEYEKQVGKLAPLNLRKINGTILDVYNVYDLDFNMEITTLNNSTEIDVNGTKINTNVKFWAFFTWKGSNVKDKRQILRPKLQNSYWQSLFTLGSTDTTNHTQKHTVNGISPYGVSWLNGETVWS